MAGLDGIKNGILPEKNGFGPLDRNIYEMCAEEKRAIKSVPGSLDEALSALGGRPRVPARGRRLHHATCLAKYVEMKREQSAEVRLRPTPLEYALYYDA